MGRGNLSISAARPLFEQLEPRVLLDADTVFGPPQDISLSPATPTCVRAVDLDGDGDADVLSASLGDDKIAWYENLGGGNFSVQKIISTAADWAWSGCERWKRRSAVEGNDANTREGNRRWGKRWDGVTGIKRNRAGRSERPARTRNSHSQI